MKIQERERERVGDCVVKSNIYLVALDMIFGEEHMDRWENINSLKVVSKNKYAQKQFEE